MLQKTVAFYDAVVFEIFQSHILSKSCVAKVFKGGNWLIWLISTKQILK